TLASTGGSGNQANNYSYSPAISADGRYVAFASDADNLVPGDTNRQRDVFVKDLQMGAITRVSTDNSGNQSNNYSYIPALSAAAGTAPSPTPPDNRPRATPTGSAAFFVGPPNTPPSASAGGPYQPPEGTPLTLTASASQFPDGASLSYSWTINGHINAA